MLSLKAGGVKIIMKKLNFEDIIQVCIGSSILAIPIAFTEEAWRISESLPQFKTILVFLTSIFFNACFIYYGVYEGSIKNKLMLFLSRIAINYALTFMTVTYILYLLDILSNSNSFISLIPKVVVVSFPASLSGAIVDSFDKE